MGTLGADDGGAEGPERDAAGAKRSNAMRRSALAPPQYSPQKFFEIILLANLCILMHFRAGLYAESNAACPKSGSCLLYTSPSPRDGLLSRMPSSA